MCAEPVCLSARENASSRLDSQSVALLAHVQPEAQKERARSLHLVCPGACVCVCFPIPIRTQAVGQGAAVEIPWLQLDFERLCAKRETQRMKRAERELPSPKIENKINSEILIGSIK